MSTKRVTNRFAELAGLYIEEAIGAVPTPDVPNPGQPETSSFDSPPQSTSTDEPVDPHSEDPKKFWLVLPAGENSVIEDVLSHVSMKDLCSIIRGSQPEEDDQFELFTNEEENKAREVAQGRLGQSSPPADQGSDMGTPTSPGNGMPPPENAVSPPPPKMESLNQDVPVKKGEGPHDGTKAKVGQIDFQNKDTCPEEPNGGVKYPDSPKVKIPSEVSAAVKSSIERTTADLEKAQKRATLDNRVGDIRPADVDYYLNLINAYDKIAGLLKDGTEDALKRLQMFIPSLPNWVTKEFPAELVKFMAAGGKAPSLKDRFKEIKSYKSQGM